MDRTYIPSFYGILNVYVHAASFEPFGFVIAEAMMNGAPIVSTPTGSALDSIKHKENGYIVEYKNSEVLRDLKEKNKNEICRKTIVNILDN